MPKIKLSKVRLESEEERERPPMNLASYGVPVGMLTVGQVFVEQSPATKYWVRSYVGTKDDGEDVRFNLLYMLQDGRSVYMDYGGRFWNKLAPIGEIYLGGKAECIGSCKVLD